MTAPQAPADALASSEIVIPELTPVAEEGQALFTTNCAVCHGANAVGSDQGPPFLDRIYEPDHHADMAFQLAAANGVRAHHWQFGSMPPVDGVTDQDVVKITAYIRELQRANGIY